MHPAFFSLVFPLMLALRTIERALPLVLFKAMLSACFCAGLQAKDHSQVRPESSLSYPNFEVGPHCNHYWGCVHLLLVMFQCSKLET